MDSQAGSRYVVVQAVFARSPGADAGIVGHACRYATTGLVNGWYDAWHCLCATGGQFQVTAFGLSGYPDHSASMYVY